MPTHSATRSGRRSRRLSLRMSHPTPRGIASSGMCESLFALNESMNSEGSFPMTRGTVSKSHPRKNNTRRLTRRSKPSGSAERGFLPRLRNSSARNEPISGGSARRPLSLRSRRVRPVRARDPSRMDAETRSARDSFVSPGWIDAAAFAASGVIVARAADARGGRGNRRADRREEPRRAGGETRGGRGDRARGVTCVGGRVQAYDVLR